MTDELNRREWIKVVGAVGAASALPVDAVPAAPASAAVPPIRESSAQAFADGELHPTLMNTSDIFVPSRAGNRMKFSFDFPEPSVSFGAHRFGFMVFTDENTYAPDPAGMKAQVNGDTMTLTCNGFTWAGGQEKAPGTLTAQFRRNGTTISWDATVEMAHPVKTVTAVVRDVPKGRVSFAGNPPPQNQNIENEIVGGYTFGAGDLHGGTAIPGISTPCAAVEASATEWFYLRSLDTKVRPKRFSFQSGERAFRTELIYEHDAWRNDKKITVPGWEIGRAPTLAAATDIHFAHIEKAYNIPNWETRTDVPAWMRKIGLVTTMHGQHYTGFIFNTYAQQLEILKWQATQMPADRQLIFLASWDGRYYWDYPNYEVSKRMGGEEGFRRLIKEGQAMGFRMMPMYGANTANRKNPIWPKIAAGETRKIDGNTYYLDWVDWNNDRHQDGWLTYMNLGHDAWRKHLSDRIAWMIEKFSPDAYFLDIIGGHVNSTTGDMHEGSRRLVMDLKRRYPTCWCVGEMPYDALHEFISVYHAGGGGRWTKYSRFFAHLSAPAPGRGSSGVHEAGFGRFNTETLGIGQAPSIPTLQVVDDTFTKHRDVMAAIIAKAKERAGI
jgi:hypothetical protein